MKPQDKPYTMTIYQLRELHRSMRKAGADVAASRQGLPARYQAEATPS